MAPTRSARTIERRGHMAPARRRGGRRVFSLHGTAVRVVTVTGAIGGTATLSAPVAITRNRTGRIATSATLSSTTATTRNRTGQIDATATLRGTTDDLTEQALATPQHRVGVASRITRGR